ncbi:hypothetical protein CGX12_13615 [Zobellella denitrificans]|uniref:transposase n=1 Tax=Zobellella denitrificans TaxID=347534 RepID=UPI000B8BDFCC|nr:transposase [Zobellella denitrificans]OXS14583.1 hypothetical protein CGX12_13615 [Zobellella denitrificans]
MKCLTRWRSAKLVRSWLEKHKQEIEVFYLPPYSPELNPDEYLNGDLKQGIRASSPARSHQDLKAKVTRHMKGFQNKPDRVKNTSNILLSGMRRDLFASRVNIRNSYLP